MDMLFDGEGVWGVVEFFVDVFIDVFELVVVGILGVVWFVKYQCVWQFGWQWCLFGLLLWFVFGGFWLGCFKFCFDGGDVGFDYFVQQIELVGIELFVVVGEVVVLQYGEFVV